MSKSKTKRMKALVIGAGEVGTNVARTLVTDGHEVTVIEKDPDTATRAAGELDAMVHEGNGASPRMLEEVQASEYDLLAAVTAIDEVNVIAALAAKRDGVKTTVARVRDPDFFRRGQASREDVLGIDFVIDPDRVAAQDIARAVQLPGAVSIEYFADGALSLAEIVLTEDSPVVGIPLAKRERPHPAFIVGIFRDGESSLTRPDIVPESGDHILVSSPTEYVRSAVAHLAGHVEEVRNCVIFGGGKIGLHLARQLEGSKIKATVLEREEDRARKLAELLPKATIMHDEGITTEAQLMAGVGEESAFVACAGDDRANLVAALSARRLGSSLSLATISKEEYTPLIDALGIDAAFSPRLIAAEEILRFVHTKNVKSIHLLRTGFEAMEMEVSPNAPLVGMAIGETHGMLKHCRVGAILHEGECAIPQRGTTISAGDRLLMLGPLGSVTEVEPSFAGES
jgi:trk system potassium uptake protein TrkA